MAAIRASLAPFFRSSAMAFLNPSIIGLYLRRTMARVFASIVTPNRTRTFCPPSVTVIAAALDGVLIGECRFALHSGANDTPSAVAL